MRRAVMAIPPSYRIEPLGSHDRADFSCGSEPLDRYLRAQAGQDIRKRVAACFTIVLGESCIAGYYTLSATSIAIADLPAAITKKLPRYPSVPAALIGRLAIDRRHQKKGLGSFLLMDAFRRTLNSDIAFFAVAVDAKDQTAKAFYEAHGFLSFPALQQRQFLPLATIEKLFQ